MDIKYKLSNMWITIIILLHITNYVCGDLSLTILHTNDMHARFEQTSQLSGECTKSPCYGGFARVAHVVRTARAKAKNGTIPEVLFLNAGDTYTGSIWFTKYRANITVDFMNLLNPDVMSLGNHEFDDGVEGLIPFVKKFKSPIVVSNLDFSNEPDLEALHLNKSVVLTVSGQKIGIIGYLTPDTKFISNTGAVDFLDEVESIRSESEMLDRKGVKIIIALGHSGFEMDKKIAKEVPLVDLVIGGHTNTFLYNGEQPDTETPQGLYPTEITQDSGKIVPVVQAYAYTKYIGRLNCRFDSNGNLRDYSGEPQLLDETVKQEQDFLDLLETYRPGIKELKAKVIGRTKVLLDQTVCRKKECNIGNFVADAFVQYHVSQYRGKYWTDVSMAIMNSGGIRTSLDVKQVNGNITLADLYTVLPFDNTLVVLSLKGSVLREVFEHSVSKHEVEETGKFLQTSGIRVRYDIKRPNGNRVVSLEALCSECYVPKYEDVNDEQLYRVIVPKFTQTGGDGYDMIKNKGFNITVEDLNDIQTVMWYIEKESPITYGEEERITFVSDTTKCVHNHNSGRRTMSALSLSGILVMAIVNILYIFNSFFFS